MDSFGPQYVYSPNGWVCDIHRNDLNFLLGLIGNSKDLNIMDKNIST